MIRSLNLAISGGAFNKVITNMGIAISSSQLVYAALTSRSVAGTSSASAVECSSVPPRWFRHSILQNSALADCLPCGLRVRAEDLQPDCADMLDAHPPAVPAAPPKTVVDTSTDSSQAGLIAGQITLNAEPFYVPGGLGPVGIQGCMYGA